MTSMHDPWSFERLQKRYRLKAELEAVTGLRVGAGKRFDAAATDQPVLRDALGQPYIPGSSLKGCLRSGLEAPLRSLGLKDLWACDLFQEPCIGPSEEKSRQQKEIPLADILAGICTACSLFGSPHLAGRIFVHDLPRISGSAPEVRDGVGIDRDLGTARDKIKYDVEVVPAGSCFELEMVFENVDEMRLALTLQALEMLHQGDILLGGLTTRGLGRVQLKSRRLESTDAKRLLSGQGYEELDYHQTRRHGEALLLAFIDSPQRGEPCTNNV